LLLLLLLLLLGEVVDTATSFLVITTARGRS
jgi:hypothetical protein